MAPAKFRIARKQLGTEQRMANPRVGDYTLVWITSALGSTTLPVTGRSRRYV